jgi:SSS family solute:Na+ symporter
MFNAMPAGSLIQVAVCICVTAFIGLATWLTIRRDKHDGSRKDVYLAGGKLSWLFVAGSITLTNLSTVSWWE